MLQQGHFAADLLYFYGEDSNLTAIFQHKAPEIPPGYGFDYINADALIHELSVANGQIVTKSGMQYKVSGTGSIQPAHVAAGSACNRYSGARWRRCSRAETHRRSQFGG